LATEAEPVPGYTLVKFLGRGGWGEVWKARCENGTLHALKFLYCDSPTSAAQEIRALQALGQVRHVHLIGIEHIWSIPGYVVIAMELADGSLQDMLEVHLEEMKTPIAAQHVCFYLRQTASALDFLNKRQHMINERRVALRHCDVKPSNILLLDDKIKLADFSLMTQTTSPMGSHRRVGSLNYCAPEVFRGQLSERTDQYSLAVTYIQLRTGAIPFADATSAIRPNYVRPQPDLSKVTPGERAVLQRALSAVPQDRWPSCTELIDRLEKSLKEAKVAS
jgi:serine/threonine protein kinase